MKPMNDIMKNCIRDCLDCYRVCLETKGYCLEQGGEHVDPEHLKKLSDCLELCKTSAHFMIKNSDLSNDICKICEEACRLCAESCEKFTDDDQMKHCAEMCRMCEESCRKMSAH